MRDASGERRAGLARSIAGACGPRGGSPGRSLPKPRPASSSVAALLALLLILSVLGGITMAKLGNSGHGLHPNGPPPSAWCVWGAVSGGAVTIPIDSATCRGGEMKNLDLAPCLSLAHRVRVTPAREGQWVMPALGQRTRESDARTRWSRLENAAQQYRPVDDLAARALAQRRKLAVRQIAVGASVVVEEPEARRHGALASAASILASTRFTSASCSSRYSK